MNVSNLEQKKKALIKDIDDLGEKQEKKRRATARMYFFLVAVGLGLSIAAVVTGFTPTVAVIDNTSISPILIILVGIPVGLERAFKFGEKRDFYRILVSEYYNLKIALNYSVDTEDKFRIILGKFQSVVARSAKSVPRGQGMQAVKTLYEELDSKGTVPVSPDLLAKP